MTNVHKWQAESRFLLEKILTARLEHAKKELCGRLSKMGVPPQIIIKELDAIAADYNKILDIFSVKRLTYRHEIIFGGNNSIPINDSDHPGNKYNSGGNNGSIQRNKG